MTIAFILGFLLVAYLVWLALHPLLVARQTNTPLVTAHTDHTLENLLFEREVTLAAIRDLQFDHAMGKLSDADFAELDARYRARAVEVLQRLDELGAPTGEADEATTDAIDAWIERAVKAARQTSQPVPGLQPSLVNGDHPLGGLSTPHPSACTACGTSTRPGDRFCAACGAALVADSATSTAS